MSAALEIAGLWAAFAVTHIGLSSLRLRPLVVARLGERGHQAVYSLLALSIFIPLVGLYFGNKHAGPWLWQLPRGRLLEGILYVGMAFAFVMVTAALGRPSPAVLPTGPGQARGIYRITRHPLIMGFALFGALHLLPNGAASDVAFFGGFVVFALLGCGHQDRRKLALGNPVFREFHAATPFLPFAGRQTLRGLRELSPLIVAIGVGLTVLVRSFHARWFGG
ncbi:MAG: NnrU family protein [Myxococcota bacterium]